GGLYESSSEEEDAGPTLPESDLESDTEDDRVEDEQEVEAGAQSEEEEEGDVREEQPESDEAGGRAEAAAAGKRVRFAEDEERSGNSSEDADTTAQELLCEDGEKYIPPHVRRAEETVDAQKREERERLKKHVRGLLNRAATPGEGPGEGPGEELQKFAGSEVQGSSRMTHAGATMDRQLTRPLQRLPEQGELPDAASVNACSVPWCGGRKARAGLREAEEGRGDLAAATASPSHSSTNISSLQAHQFSRDPVAAGRKQRPVGFTGGRVGSRKAGARTAPCCRLPASVLGAGALCARLTFPQLVPEWTLRSVMCLFDASILKVLILSKRKRIPENNLPTWTSPICDDVWSVSLVQVGAHFLEAVVRKFDDVYRNGSEGKECDNLFTIVAHLYNFHVVHSLLVFDILKKLIRTFTEKDIELILLMLKNVGFSLRKDDALSLKELISETQAKASGAGSQFQDQTRIRFMLETMLALKNNDMRKIPGYDPEPVERLRKAQRALVRSASSGTEAQLRVSWDSVLNAERTGRWWIVGSAWTGAPMIDSSQQKVPQKQLAGTVSTKMLDLARKQRMNTDVRRTIFCTIMTSEDFLDAFEKLLKLGLKDQQEREIVHVLVDCCLQEKTYNPFYAFLAGRLCDCERRLQMTFQFSIWDKFRDLENLPATNFSNLVHLVAHLLKMKSLPLSILKVVEFSELDKPRVHFLRKVLHILLTETEVEDLGVIFTRVADNPKLGVLREGLKLFISHFLLKSAHGGAQEAGVLRARADLAAKALHGRATVRM
ncbi:nucleolar MIF4G domain-containing protein 1, partial [Pteropus vampyrus]|uniref:Nucleolar MIF4G domain-containing protein 1 n=1 Tax=Pteropus vampyrus TaxID=132908 RepID=A0A6P6CYB5_PTEVA